RVDSTQGEDDLGFLSGESPETAQQATDRAAQQGAKQATRQATEPAPDHGKVRILASMAFVLRANCGPRWLSGFLTLFMAFLLRVHPISGHSPQFLLAAVIGAAGLGNFVGIAVGSVMKGVNPKLTVVLAMLAGAAAAVLAALTYGLFSLVVLGFVAGLAQCLAKLSLDSTIQRDVPERVR